MVQRLISGMVYCQIRTDSNLFEWHNTPDDEIQKTIEKKYKNLTRARLETLDNNCKEETLEIVPLSSISLKGMIKYIPRNDSCSKNIINSFFMILFKEVDDLIFYKYKTDLSSLFSKFATKFRDLTHEADNLSGKIQELLADFNRKVITQLESLKEKELVEKRAEKEEEIDVKVKKKKEFVFKIVVCGDAAVGKTSLVLKFTDNAFRRQYLPTLGVNISEKKLTLNNASIKLMLWDLSGQKKFKMMRTSSYPGALAYIFVFDTTNPQTLKNLEFWYKEVDSINKNIIGLLLGNKIDLQEQENIDEENLKDFRANRKLKYFRTSALTGENVEKAFEYLAEKLYYKRKKPTI